jgi:hypothetical protein
MTRQRKKIFDFLKLPRELRDYIFAYYLELEYIRRNERQQPNRARLGRELLPIGEFKYKSTRALPAKRRRSHSLMLVNKQVSSEYVEYVCKCSNFTFHIQDKARRGWKCANWRLSSVLWANLRQCSVHFDDMEADFVKLRPSKMRGMMLNLDNFVSQALQLQFIRFRAAYGGRYYYPDPDSPTPRDKILDDIRETMILACNRNNAVQKFYTHICNDYREYERDGSAMVLKRSGVSSWWSWSGIFNTGNGWEACSS